ncbi:DUF1868 domain-containing protein [Alkalinema pantanalense CENA528]|uniref:DUF1868 domain-containing protein n=1 Tax=Alkalinema pantanalense TaxID=1620705 RepID=UPI003D6E9398
MDETYQIYLNRLMRMTLPETYRSQVQNIQQSPKFERSQPGDWQPSPFPGYTVITPPGPEDSANPSLYERLTDYQHQLVKTLGPDVFIPIAPESFHLTIADIIWESAYRHATEDPEFDGKLRSGIAQSFEQSTHLTSGQPIPFRVAGLIVMTRAIGLALAATDEVGYNQILELRRAIYQNPNLIAIGIEQQYHFTPHITLGYLGDVSQIDRETMAETCDQLNQPWLEATDATFWVKQAELRHFPNMMNYHREADWPVFQF